MSFWEIFKNTAYFRISWKIQDELINLHARSQRRAELRSLEENKDEIIDKVYNNKFTRARKRP